MEHTYPQTTVEVWPVTDGHGTIRLFANEKAAGLYAAEHGGAAGAAMPVRTARTVWHRVCVKFDFDADSYEVADCSDPYENTACHIAPPVRFLAWRLPVGGVRANGGACARHRRLHRPPVGKTRIQTPAYWVACEQADRPDARPHRRGRLAHTGRAEMDGTAGTLGIGQTHAKSEERRSSGRIRP